MSYDLAVWYPDRVLTNEEAVGRYHQLCDGNNSVVVSNQAVEAFYNELTALHPEIDDIPDEDVDDLDLCPWSIAFDKSPGHLIMCCVWSKAEHVDDLVKRLAIKHSLAVFDPQSGKLFLPAHEPTPTKKLR